MVKNSLSIFYKSFLFILLSFSLHANNLPIFGDTIFVKKISKAIHYFLPTFFTTYYNVPKRKLDVSLPVGKILKDYSSTQYNFGFYTPIYTKNIYNRDSTIISNWHVLATGNLLLSSPVFSGLTTQHQFIKAGIGCRLMYNNGKKDIFFFELSPFLLKDLSASSAIFPNRSASTFVWSHIINEKFSFRLGYNRLFLYGNRLTLPYLGLRFGRLDKIYLSIQFPRSIFFNVPIVRSLSFNALVKPVGNVFAYKDIDSIYAGSNKSLIFGLKDIVFGLGFNYHPSRFISLFINSGLVTSNSTITLFSESFNKGNKFNSFNYFYNQNLARSTFINIGLTLRFGTSKSSYGDRNIYELQNTNTDLDVGNNNIGGNQSEITPNGKLKSLNKIRFKDVADLVNDLDVNE